MPNQREPKKLMKSGDEDTRFIKDICSVCKADLEIEQIAFAGTWYPQTFICDPCIVKEKEKEEQQRQQGISETYLKHFEELCPRAMSETDLARLNQAKLQEVMSYDNSTGKGLMLYGATGLGKTRTLWMLLKHITVHDRYTDWKFYSSTELARELTTAYAFGKTNIALTPQALFHYLTTIGILILDDFGKEKLTPRVESEIFDVIRARTDNLKPIFFTSNFDGEKLIARFNDPYTAEPLIRRIREFCTGVHFK